MLTEPGSAKSALDRIVIPQDVLDHIAGIAPRSSLIVTDEALSSETGSGTDFVVPLSDEPQGGIKTRRRGPGNEFSYARPRDSPALLALAFRGPVFHLVSPFLSQQLRSRSRRSIGLKALAIRRSLCSGSLDVNLFCYF
jgi:hypothetical protein